MTQTFTKEQLEQAWDFTIQLGQALNQFAATNPNVLAGFQAAHAKDETLRNVVLLQNNQLLFAMAEKPDANASAQDQANLVLTKLMTILMALDLTISTLIDSKLALKSELAALVPGHPGKAVAVDYLKGRSPTDPADKKSVQDALSQAHPRLKPANINAAADLYLKSMRYDRVAELLGAVGPLPASALKKGGNGAAPKP